LSSEKLFGIDVSRHQGKIDWSKVKCDFAIIRMGFGDDSPNQKDERFIENVKGCIENNIPFALYFYSYAVNLTGKSSIESEITHTKNLLNELKQIGKPCVVFIDMEDKSIVHLGRQRLTEHALRWCEAIAKEGYKVGVYANQNWFNNYIEAKPFSDRGYSIWIARYGPNKPELIVSYDIWQYSEKGRVDGISGHDVDLNYCYNPSLFRPDGTTTQGGIDTDKDVKDIRITYQVKHEQDESWLPNVVNDSDYAGKIGSSIKRIIMDINHGNITYKVHIKSNAQAGVARWLPEVNNREDYAGFKNAKIDAVMIKASDVNVMYRVHLKDSNKWLPYATGYDENDNASGYAGVLEHEIDAIQVIPTGVKK
jgi:GH25 family lysozyme M1 (1,4-beta-N-acetylmuramidase)